MRYFDAHLHLIPDDCFFRAREKGVTQFICNSVLPSDWDDLLALSQRVLGVYVCLGVHPWYVDRLEPLWDRALEQKLRDNPLAMIGETGLDKTRPNYSLQKQIFIRHMELARKYNRKVHIHCVKAWDDLFEVLGEFRDISILIHRFSGNEVIVQRLRFSNAFFSVLNDNCIDIIPDNRLLIESDAPDGLKSPEFIPDLVQKLNLDVDYLLQNMDLFLHD